MKNRMIRADFAISRDKEQVRKVGHSTIYVPEIRYTGKGMKWLDESQYRRTDNNRGEDNNEEDNRNDPE